MGSELGPGSMASLPNQVLVLGSLNCYFLKKRHNAVSTLDSSTHPLLLPGATILGLTMPPIHLCPTCEPAE